MTTLTMRIARTADGAVRHVPTPFVPKPAKAAKKARRVPDPIKTNGETAAEEIRLLLERLERLHEERKGVTDDIKDVEAEARSRGFDSKALNEIRKIRLKAKEQYQEETAVIEVYMQSLGML